jgi:acyl carrier protein
VDRRALPTPDAHRPGLGESFTAPRNPAEERIAALWADVLGLDRVGVHDDFFALGGHSLLATRLLARLQADLGIVVPVRALFEHPTVADLAMLVDLEQVEVALPA